MCIHIYNTQIYITMFFLSFLSRFLLLDMFGYILLYVGHTLILIFLNILVLTSKRGKKRKKQGGKRTVGSSPLSSNGGETSPPGWATAMEAHLPVYPHLCDQKQQLEIRPQVIKLWRAAPISCVWARWRCTSHFWNTQRASRHGALSWNWLNVTS